MNIERVQQTHKYHKQINNVKQLYNMMIKYFIVGLLIFQTFCLHVDTKTSLIQDSFGRYSIFHGVNAVFKTQPFYPQLEGFDANSSLSEIDLKNLKSWGMNVIRLHVAWEGVQPNKNQYNYTYIEILRTIVRNCHKYGIHVLLDSHQDLFSKKFCGQGFPDWAVERTSFPSPLKIKLRFDEKGYPLRQDCLKLEFGLFYTTFDVMNFQQSFYLNEHGLADQFAKMWGVVSKYMSDEPNILGYEVLNQPAGPSLYTHPYGLLGPGQSNNKYLLPMYKKVYNQIRKYDEKNLIFFEPSTFDVLAGGFYDTPGGQNQISRQVYSYHVYCPYVTALGQPKSKPICNGFDELTVQSKVGNIKKLKIGGMLTQFGALSNSQKSAQQILDLTSYVQANFHGWTYWQFKYFNDITTAANPGSTESFYDQYGNLQKNKVIALSHPYAYSICGTPVKTYLNKKQLYLQFIAADCSNKFTELYLNEEFYYQSGFNFTISPDCGSQCSLIQIERSYYELRLPKKLVNRSIKITISPK